MIHYCPNCGYKLTEDTSPVAETPQNRLSEVTAMGNNIESDYISGNNGIAIPKVSDYRERYKKKQLRAKDIRAGESVLPIPPMSDEMDQFGDLVIGEGLQQEI